jgi:hypothetical protein
MMNEKQVRLPTLSVKSDILSSPFKARRSSTIQLLRMLAVVVVSAIAGAGIGIPVVKFLPGSFQSISHGNPWLFALAALLALYLVLVTHECGHLLAGGRLAFASSSSRHVAAHCYSLAGNFFSDDRSRKYSHIKP